MDASRAVRAGDTRPVSGDVLSTKRAVGFQELTVCTVSQTLGDLSCQRAF